MRLSNPGKIFHMSFHNMDGKNQGKLIIFSAPSGAGKTTIVRAIMEKFPNLEFSVSCTSRPPRGEEKHGKDYFFLTPEEFREAVDSDEFVEWEEVYTDTHYGTLRSEVERIWAKGNAILFDVDVKGGLNLKSIFGEQALAIFVMPPSVETLRERLERRGTDSSEKINKRVEKAEYELMFAPQFDFRIMNDDLQAAIAEVESLVTGFLSK